MKVWALVPDIFMSNENKHNCGCGCGEHEHEHDHEGCCCGEHEHDHDALIVDLEDENGNVVACEVVDGFHFKDNDYALVQNPEDGSVYLFKVVGDDEESELQLPDDKEFEEATAYYQSIDQE